MKASTESLFEAYHSAVNSVGAAAVPLYKQAVQDCEDSIVEVLEGWDFDVLRLAASGMRDDLLHDLLCETVDNSRWSFITYQAQAVYDGADRLGIAAEHLEGDENGVEEQAFRILFGVLASSIEGIVSHVRANRVAWAMENR
jgi:hypothetical protein